MNAIRHFKLKNNIRKCCTSNNRKDKIIVNLGMFYIGSTILCGICGVVTGYIDGIKQTKNMKVNNIEKLTCILFNTFFTGVFGLLVGLFFPITLPTYAYIKYTE